MSDLIDRKQISAYIADQSYLWEDDYDIDQVLEDIQNAPAVEAEPVRHGHWIDEGVYSDNFSLHAWRCSKCGWHELEIEEPYGNYCRNCGAKMDERKEE